MKTLKLPKKNAVKKLRELYSKKIVTLKPSKQLIKTMRKITNDKT